MSNSIYIHTLENKPAFFNGQQICYSYEGGGGKGNGVAYSLQQIRDEQKLSAEYRNKRKFSINLKFGYRRYCFERPTPSDPR